MRPKVVVAILLLAVGLLSVIFLMSKTLHPQSTSSSADSGKVPPAAAASTNLVMARASDPQPVVSAAPAPAVGTNDATGTNDAAAHTQYVRQQIEKLNALSWNDDRESGDAILSELKNNPDKKIRAAALEAAIQFNDRSVVPPMQEIAAQTQDPGEKAAILEAIDYINLPSLSEYLAANPNSTPGSAPRRSSSHAHRPPTQSPAQSPDSGQ